MFAAARQETPAGKKLLRFYSFNDRFNEYFFLMCCRPWVQKLRYVFLYKPILSEKNSLSSAALCDPLVISSQLELSVVCGVIFLSGVTATTFLLAFKNRKMHGFG